MTAYELDMARSASELASIRSSAWEMEATLKDISYYQETGKKRVRKWYEGRSGDALMGIIGFFVALFLAFGVACYVGTASDKAKRETPEYQKQHNEYWYKWHGQKAPNEWVYPYGTNAPKPKQKPQSKQEAESEKERAQQYRQEYWTAREP